VEGDESQHLDFRRRVTSYIEDHEETYKLFIEDDEPFNKYISRMKKEGKGKGYFSYVRPLCATFFFSFLHSLNSLTL
jgi:hypothetical protein